MLQLIRGVLVDFMLAAIEWVTRMVAIRIQLQQQLEVLEERALTVSATLFAMQAPECRWN